MKLRVKFVHGPPDVHRIEIANGASLADLRSIVQAQLPGCEGVDDLQMSLNKKVRAPDGS